MIWVAAIAGLLFLIVHAIYVRYFAKPEEFAGTYSPTLAAALPSAIPRHSLAARLFHWVMAASMFTLLFTAFLPKVGVQFDWVTYHWIAGTVLTVSIIFHIIHASFWLDFWSIWPDRADLDDAGEGCGGSWANRRRRREDLRNIRWKTSCTTARSSRLACRRSDRRVHDVPRATPSSSLAIPICSAT